MRAVDAWAIEEQGVPSLDLMERAGAGLARVAAEAARPGRLRVVIGKGNNGGDGLVAARLLRADGHEVDVLTVAPLDELRGDALANLERLPGAAPEPFAAERLEGSGVVVDALLGTGFEGVAARAGGRCDRGDQRAGRRLWSPATCPPASTPRPARSTGEAVRARRRRPSTARSSACTSSRAAATRVTSRWSRSASRAAPRSRAGRG